MFDDESLVQGRDGDLMPLPRLAKFRPGGRGHLRGTGPGYRRFAKRHVNRVTRRILSRELFKSIEK